ncbi:MAG: hypothetical protein ACHREM_06525 [Polyangiales bacterium]
MTDETTTEEAAEKRATNERFAKVRAAREKRNALYDRPVATWTDGELLTVLRERYEPTVVPPCSVCGGALSMQRIGAGEPTVWACSPQEDDPDRPGHLRLKTTRNAVDDHYDKSRFVDRRQGGDSEVMEAVDRMLKRQKPLGEAARVKVTLDAAIEARKAEIVKGFGAVPNEQLLGLVRVDSAIGTAVSVFEKSRPDVWLVKHDDDTVGVYWRHELDEITADGV